jgi:hypothetical protein
MSTGYIVWTEETFHCMIVIGRQTKKMDGPKKMAAVLPFYY